MDVESSRYVVTLAEELHFGRSARRHFLDPGHFSRPVLRLERDLATRLFDRTSRRVALTPAGQRVVAQLPAVAGPPPEDDAAPENEKDAMEPLFQAHRPQLVAP